MQVNKIFRSNINFQSAQLNIAATADNHGSITSIPQLIKTVQENNSDIFENSDEKSTMNLFAIAGDYFMYPEKRGLLTKKDKTIGDIQFGKDDFVRKKLRSFQCKIRYRIHSG